MALKPQILIERVNGTLYRTRHYEITTSSGAAASPEALQFRILPGKATPSYAADSVYSRCSINQNGWINGWVEGTRKSKDEEMP